jgi:hypothetical protein
VGQPWGRRKRILVTIDGMTFRNSNRPRATFDTNYTSAMLRWNTPHICLCPAAQISRTRRQFAKNIC